MKKYPFLLSLFFLISPLYTVAQETYSYQLDNGLRLIVKPDHRFPTVVSQVWYKVGSSYEHNGITGISHALEHMMFRGTQAYPSGKIIEIIAKQGGIQNAFTNYDYTAYYQVLPADKLHISFELEADRMQNLLLSKKLFIPEMKAIQEERRLRTDDDPEAVMAERFLAAAYVSTPYHHPVIGWKNDLDHMTIEDLKQWYQRWYSPNNATLVVVGDVDPQKTFELAKHYFGKIPARPFIPLKPQAEIDPLGKKTIDVNIPAKLPSIVIGYPVPTLTTAHDPKTAYALLMLSEILTGGESSRLEKKLVRQQQIATAVEGGYDIYQRKNSLLFLYGIPAQGHDVNSIKEHFLQQIDNLQKTLIEPKELERVKSLTIAKDVFKKDSIQAQADLIGKFESVGLSFKQIDETVKQIEKITPEDIQRVAQTYLKPNHMIVGILTPLPMSPKTSTSSPKRP